jgi:hypothetical protein
MFIKVTTAQAAQTAAKINSPCFCFAWAIIVANGWKPMLNIVSAVYAAYLLTTILNTRFCVLK